LLKIFVLGGLDLAALNPLVDMTTASHRAVELLVGLSLLGYCAYAIYSGEVMGKFRSYNRIQNPSSFWTTILVTFGIGAVFLFGYVSWRD
jgi:hypothetical protein